MSTIPEAAVEAALSALFPGKEVQGFTRAVQEPIIRTILEAAAPHMLAGIVARLDENVTALENTLVDEHDYPALCAQREALIGVIQMLRDRPTP